MTAVALAALTACDDGPRSAPPAPVSTAVSAPEQPPPNLAAWVESLPRGEPPEVAYAVGTTLHLPGGVRVPIRGTQVEILGATRRGTMLLVERPGAEFDTDYVWVAPDGDTTVLPDTRSHGVQDAAVSPDGRWFARGGEVIALADGSVIAEIPERAVIVTGWTRDGLVYATRDDRVWVWPPDGSTFEYGFNSWIWYPGTTPVGIWERRGCWSVVRVWSYDDLSSWPRRCAGPDPLTVSPRASWVLTRDLAVRDPFAEVRGHLAGGPVQVSADTGTYWESDRRLLVALPTGLVRCDARTLSCERVAEGEVVLPLR